MKVNEGKQIVSALISSITGYRNSCNSWYFFNQTVVQYILIFT